MSQDPFSLQESSSFTAITLGINRLLLHQSVHTPRTQVRGVFVLLQYLAEYKHGSSIWVKPKLKLNHLHYLQQDYRDEPNASLLNFPSYSSLTFSNKIASKIRNFIDLWPRYQNITILSSLKKRHRFSPLKLHIYVIVSLQCFHISFLAIYH